MHNRKFLAVNNAHIENTFLRKFVDSPYTRFLIYYLQIIIQKPNDWITIFIVSMCCCSPWYLHSPWILVVQRYDNFFSCSSAVTCGINTWVLHKLISIPLWKYRIENTLFMTFTCILSIYLCHCRLWVNDVWKM